MGEELVPANAAAVPTGLEDFNDTDQSVPRLKISHKNATFVDTATNEEFGELTVVLLGLVRQRVLWDAEIDDDARPLCKSYDFELGVPDIANFPWGAAGFDKSDFASQDEPRLSCGSCKLKEWDTHPSRKAPWCTEQFVLPLLMPLDEGGVAPAILTLQRSAIKPAKDYIGGFARAKLPLFANQTHMKLNALRKGTTDYAVPVFKKGEPVDASEHGDLATSYLGIRDFLQTPRTRRDDDASSTSSTPASSDGGKSPSTGTPGVEDEEEIPF